MTYAIGNVFDVLPTLDAGRFRCCVTSPPYWGLRDYGHPDQLGLEATPELYVEHMVAVFREVRRTLTDDGTCWINIGDSYASGGTGGASPSSTLSGGGGRYRTGSKLEAAHDAGAVSRAVPSGCKPKDLVGIPWMLAFALRADGWYLRSDIIWSKPNPMPESVKDRPTKAHEYVFLLSKSASYYYDADALAEPTTWRGQGRTTRTAEPSSMPGAPPHRGLRDDAPDSVEPTRNARSVWTIAPRPFSGAHFAVMPEELARRCIVAGSAVGDEVIDPFLGSGTVGRVAEAQGRHWFGVELQPDYEPIIRQRTAQAGLLAIAAGGGS